jgi:Zn-dependent metalloprotease
MLRADVQRITAAALAAVTLAAGAARVAGQEPPATPPGVQSLTEPGQGLDVHARSADGRVSFASRAGRGVLLRGLQGAPAHERAMAFVEDYGAAFGLRGRTEAEPIGPARRDALGQDHVRLQQLHDGVPVTAGQLIVHLQGDRVVAANAHTLADLPPLPGPTVAPAAAVDAARALVSKHRPEQAADARFGNPRLEVFNRGMIDEGTHPTRLAWFVEATGGYLREYIWIDAHTGAVLLNFSQLTDVKSRTVFTMNHDLNVANLPGVLVRSEGQLPVTDADANQAYDFSGQTYDYFALNHGRDSYDGAGAQLQSSVRFGSGFQNAFWNGTQMVYGDGFAAADDVVAHELTHAVTEHSANLFYYYQSGALNESFSDIFGETMDLTTGLTSTDRPAQRWQLAEDLSIGAIRNMVTPALFHDPGKMSDPEFVCASDGATNPNADRGGVHSNSGVPNHAFALMVDGGTYNGRTITGIGLTKAARIQYRALTTYLTSGSTFADDAVALNQSCSDLTGTLGITSADCGEVNNAILAVEMTSPWPCVVSTPPPSTSCPIGSVPNPIFADGFEAGGANWTSSSTTSNEWGIAAGFAKAGLHSAWGDDVDLASDHRLSLANAVMLPANARMSFDHAFEFEHAASTGTSFDGGVLEYSTNGTTWNDAGPLIDAGQAYSGTFAPGNVLGSRSGFVRSSAGYTATRLDLAGLSGQSVRFRFRIGTDQSVGSLGWLVDNVRIYTCGTAPPPTSVNDVYPTPFQTALQVAAPGVLLNDTGNGGGVITASLVTGASSGTLTLNADGSFGYTPRGGFVGTDTFTYRAVTSVGPGNIATVTITTAPPPPTGLHAASIVGNTVTLRWTPPAAGPAPTGYVLEGGVSPSQVQASIATGSTAPIYTIVAPTGSFYVRMHALSGAGRSAASNEILIHANLPVPPSAPVNLLGLVDGNTVALAWLNTFAGGAPSGVLLDVSGPVTTTIPLGATESIQFASVPEGAYTLRVRARNAAGVSSDSSNTMTLTVPGPCSGVPLAPASLLTFRDGRTIFAYWDPPAAGPAPTGYIVDATGEFAGSFPTTGRSLSGNADPGAYHLSVRARNACGSGPATAVQTVTIP